MSSSPAAAYPYRDDLETEAVLWHEITDLVHRLTPDERLRPGYLRTPGWSVRDVAAHLGTWLAEGDLQFQQILTGTYENHPVDVDGLNASLLQAMHDQPWDTVWDQANAARTVALHNWTLLPAETPEATWWIEKCGPQHYWQHVPRLREWVDELVTARSAGRDITSG